MAQDGEWVSLKAYMDTLGEKYLRESINWDAINGINGINELEQKVPRVITDVYLDLGNDDPTTQ